MGLMILSNIAQAEIYVVDGLAVATYATTKGFKHRSMYLAKGKWINDDLDFACGRTNGYVLSVVGTPFNTDCWFDIFYGKTLKSGWKFIDSKFKKISSNNSVSYRIKKRYKNTNKLAHSVLVTRRRGIRVFKNKSIQLVSITLEGPANAKWTDAF